VRVIPVLVGGAPMPTRPELPGVLGDLRRRNALELSDNRWSYDVGLLVEAIEKIVGPAESEAAAEETATAAAPPPSKPTQVEPPPLPPRPVLGPALVWKLTAALAGVLLFVSLFLPFAQGTRESLFKAARSTDILLAIVAVVIVGAALASIRSRRESLPPALLLASAVGLGQLWNALLVFPGVSSLAARPLATAACVVAVVASIFVVRSAPGRASLRVSSAALGGALACLVASGVVGIVSKFLVTVDIQGHAFKVFADSPRPAFYLIPSVIALLVGAATLVAGRPMRPLVVAAVGAFQVGWYIDLGEYLGRSGVHVKVGWFLALASALLGAAAAVAALAVRPSASQRAPQ
jgi:hypothetical protein